jgi:hypothetical protein
MNFWKNYLVFLKSHGRGGPAAVLRRFTWEGLQTLVGGAVGTYCLATMQVDAIQSYDGVVVIRCWNLNRYWGGLAFGSVILGDARIVPVTNNALFMHEFGHVLQSRASGPIYLFKYGIPSVMSVRGTGTHNQHPVEQDANLRAFEFFRKMRDFRAWPQETNPVKANAATLPIVWWEFLPPIFPIAHLVIAVRDRNGRPSAS